MLKFLIHLYVFSRQSIDSYTITASPSFGFIKGASTVRYSSLDLGTQSGYDLNLKSPLLSGSVLEKDDFDKDLKRHIDLIGDEVISSHLQFHGGLGSHGCSVTQTIFNGKILFRCTLLFPFYVILDC